MATELQKRAVKRIVENGGKISRSMVEVGYSPETAHTPQKLTQSKGYKELMEEYGLTDGLVARVLVEDIKNKPQDRVQELKLGAEILGMKQVQGTGETKNLIVITSETAQRYGIPTQLSETDSA